LKRKRDEFVAAQPHATLSTGEVIRMLRELKGWTQENRVSVNPNRSRLSKLIVDEFLLHLS
jgi:hypothetical protein